MCSLCTCCNNININETSTSCTVTSPVAILHMQHAVIPCNHFVADGCKGSVCRGIFKGFPGAPKTPKKSTGIPSGIYKSTTDYLVFGSTSFRASKKLTF